MDKRIRYNGWSPYTSALFFFLRIFSFLWQPELPMVLSFQDVIKLETQYWTLVDIPRQEKQETVPAFVLRACSIMEKTHKSGEGVKTSARLAEEAETKRERIERLESKYSECGNRSLSRVVIVVDFAEGRKQFSIVLRQLFLVLCRSFS